VRDGGQRTVLSRVGKPQQLSALLLAMAHGGGSVNSVAFSADGGRVVSGGSDGNVKLWDAATGAPVEGGTHDEPTPTAENFTGAGCWSSVCGVHLLVGTQEVAGGAPAYAGAVLLESKVSGVCVRGGSVLVLFQDTSTAFYRVCPAAEASEVMHYVHRVRHALANGSGEMRGFDAAGAGALESAAAAAAEWAGERGSEATAGELAAKLAELQASCEPVFERAKKHLRLVAALQEYALRIRRALSDHAREPQLSAADAAALESAAAGAEALLGERGGEATAAELAAKLADLEATCSPALLKADEWSRAVVPLAQYIDRICGSSAGTSADGAGSIAAGSAAAEAAVWLGKRDCAAAVDALTTQLKELVGDVFVDGQPQGQPQAGMMGMYKLMAPVKVVNGLAVWQAAGGNDAYLYVSGDRRWRIGNCKLMSRGANRGTVRSVRLEAGAFRPEQVDGGWEVKDGRNWKGSSVCVRAPTAEEKADVQVVAVVEQ
jgi:hypothetical protein